MAAPALVPRRRLTEGEALETIVIRSNPDPVDAIAALALGPNAQTYAATGAATASGYFATNDRHVAPPKTSQDMAEKHAMFNFKKAQDAYNVAIKEAGTFHDPSVIDITTGASIPLPAGEAVLIDPKMAGAFAPARPRRPARSGAVCCPQGRSTSAALPARPDGRRRDVRGRRGDADSAAALRAR